MPRRPRRPTVLSLLPALGAAACMSGDDARKALDAVQTSGAPDSLPVMRNAELPFHYPPGLYAQRVQGNVTLRLFIDSLGAVLPESTLVAEPSGYPELDTAAVHGARQLSFVPAKRDGRPVGLAVKFPILFRHPDAPPLPGDSTMRGPGIGGAGPGE
jgi:TonB family protein